MCVCWCWCRCCWWWWWCYSWKGWGVILFTVHFPCVPDGNNSALVLDKWRMTSHHLIQYWHCRRRIYKSTVGQALHVVGLIDDMFWKTKECEIDMKQCIWINTAIRFYIKTILIYLYDLYSRCKIPIQSKVTVNDIHIKTCVLRSRSVVCIMYCYQSILTYGSLEKIVDISQTTFSNAFSWKMYKFGLSFHCSLFLSFELILLQHWYI